MSAPKPARQAVAVTGAEKVPQPRMTRTEYLVNLLVGGVLCGALFVGGLAVWVTS